MRYLINYNRVMRGRHISADGHVRDTTNTTCTRRCAAGGVLLVAVLVVISLRLVLTPNKSDVNKQMSE